MHGRMLVIFGAWREWISMVGNGRDATRTLADHGLNNTDFWGPASNFGIPIAAVMDTQKDPEMYV